MTEAVREGVRKLEAYVEEMSSSEAVNAPVDVDKVHAGVLKLWNAVQSQPGISEEQVSRIKDLHDSVINSLNTKGPETKLKAAPQPRARRASSQFLRPHAPGGPSVSEDKIPLLHLKRKVGTSWEYSSNLTGVYLDVLNEIATSGTSFKDKNAQPTGVGKGSIGVEILKGLLSGGAHVVITTSRCSRATVEYYQAIFQRHGSKGSALTVFPFTRASKQDAEALIDYIYTSLGMDLDYIPPFALSLRMDAKSMVWMTSPSSLTESCWSTFSISWVQSRTRRPAETLSLALLRSSSPSLPTTVSSVTMVSIPSPRFLSKPSLTAGALKAGVNTYVSPVPSLGA